MKKTLPKIFLLLGMFIPSILWANMAKEGLCFSTGKGLQLYYFDENLSKFSIKEIVAKSKIFQIAPTGTIYCLTKNPVLYQEKILPEFGIKLVYIKEPENFYDFYSGICVNPTTSNMYFPKKKNDRFFHVKKET